MTSQPVVTVIIPVHNTEYLVERTLCSVLTQEGDFRTQILLVENGSTDNSLNKIQNLSKLYPNVECLVSPKVGLSEARNYGVKHASGDYIVFIDSDDFIEPDMIQSLLNAKLRYKAEVVYCNYILEYEDGTIWHAFPDTGGTVEKSGLTCPFEIITEISTSSACVRIFDRDFFSSHSFPEGVCYEDHLCIYRWMAECKKLVHIDRPLYHYCIRENGITGTTYRSPDKIADLFNADYGRLSFIHSTPGFSEEQRKIMNHHVLAELFRHLTDYIQAVSHSGDAASDSRLMTLRQLFLEGARSIPLSHAGMKLTRKSLRVRYLWKKILHRYCK